MKKINIFSLESVFLFLFLIIFPFGQITRLSFNLIGIGIPLLPIDIIAGCGAFYAIIKNFRKPGIFKYIARFLWIVIFTFIFSIFIFKTPFLIYGLFYLLRLVAYSYFFIYVWNFVRGSAKNQKLLQDSLLVVSVASAVFGWVQFFMVPDIKALFIYGWDMHLFRLVGTFLDPAFLGLIIVFGLLISIARMIEVKKYKYLGVILFLIVSLAFTYSRASYLALFAGLLVIAWYKKFIKKAIVFILIFSVLLFLLPTSLNHSIELLRGFSALARIDNYKTTLKIFLMSPVFGAGYNNMCIAYQKYIGFQPFFSHACSGSDSSLLMVLTTTGTAGFIIFVNMIYKIGSSLKHDSKFQVLTSSFTALLVHSLFSNSLFYPWILGYIVILLAMSVKD